MSLIFFKILLLQTTIVSTLSVPRYRDQFKNVCGRQNKIGRIVGGSDAAKGEFPFITRIGVKFDPPYFFCGGSLITDLHVLTAEHCFYECADQKILHLLIVSLGDHSVKARRSFFGRHSSDQPVIYKVASLIPYNFDETTLINDISILKLADKVEFTRWISPICLPDNPSAIVSIGDKLVTIGFGLVNSRKKQKATTLQKITIPIRPHRDCEKFSEILSAGQLCAGSPTKDSCNGDSGGPLFKLTDGMGRPRYTQLGIVSYGSEYCEDKEPAVYEGVLSFLEWIDDMLDKH